MSSRASCGCAASAATVGPGAVRVAAAGQGDGPHREHGWTPARRLGQSIDCLPRRVEAAVEHLEHRRLEQRFRLLRIDRQQTRVDGERGRARRGIGAGALLEQPPEVDVGRRRSRLQADGRLEMILGGPRLAAPCVDHAGEIADDRILGKRGDRRIDCRLRRGQVVAVEGGRDRVEHVARRQRRPGLRRGLSPGLSPRRRGCGQRRECDRGDEEARAGHGFDAAPAAPRVWAWRRAVNAASAASASAVRPCRR